MSNEGMNPEDPEDVLRFLQDPSFVTEPLDILEESSEQFEQEDVLEPKERALTVNVIEPDKVLDSLAGMYQKVTDELDKIVIGTVLK